MQVIDRAGVPGVELAALVRQLQAMATLEDVVRWCFATGSEIVEVVVQDEYSHDVVVSRPAGRYLVFDTT